MKKILTALVLLPYLSLQAMGGDAGQRQVKVNNNEHEMVGLRKRLNFHSIADDPIRLYHLRNAWLEKIGDGIEGIIANAVVKNVSEESFERIATAELGRRAYLLDQIANEKSIMLIDRQSIVDVVHEVVLRVFRKTVMEKAIIMGEFPDCFSGLPSSPEDEEVAQIMGL